MEKRKVDDSYRHVLKYTGIFGGVQGLKVFVDILRNKLTARMLGKVGMGLNAVYLNISEIMNSWTNFGIPFYTTRRVSELYEEGTEDDMQRFVEVIRTWSFWTAFLGGFLCFALASWLNQHYLPGEQHTLEIMLVSLFVASLPIEAVECSILKGLRRLRTVALIEVVSAISTLLFTIPFYYIWGMRGIAISLVFCGWAAALIHLYFSTQLYRYRIYLFSLSVIREGWPIARIGIPYMLAGVLSAMATGEVYRYLEDMGEVGLYRAGVGLMVIYGGLVFKAIEADYFPRLSSVNHDTVRINHLINQQIDVCVLLLTPILILLILFMPLIVRILWTEEYLPVVPMAICAVFYLFFKSVAVPIAYTALAKADSWLFMIMEACYYSVFIVALRYGYAHWGLTGAGVGLSFMSMFDMFLVGIVYGFHYKVRVRKRTLLIFLSQGLLLLLTVVMCMKVTPWAGCLIGTICLLVSSVFSWRYLSPELPIVEKLKKRLHL